MKNAIVTAADSKYLPAACCALLSCIWGGEAEAKLFMLACDVSAEDAKKADSFLKKRGASVEIITVEADRFRQFRIDGYISASTYSRLLLPEFFTDQWDRLLYVDADMRVMARLQPLLNVNLHGRPIGAVHDYLQYLIYGIEGSRTRLCLGSDAPYFNAGVICFDWHATIASGLLQRAKAFAIESPHLCKAHDQDALNKAFEGAWMPLDPRWNFMTVAIPEKVLRLDYPARFRPYISHFAGPVKPWTASFPVRYENHRAWYRELLQESPWPRFVASACNPSSETSATAHANGLRGWFLALCRRSREAFQRLLSGRMRPMDEPRLAAAQGSPSTKHIEGGHVNPELERQFDGMVAEAAGFDIHGAH